MQLEATVNEEIESASEIEQTTMSTMRRRMTPR